MLQALQKCYGSNAYRYRTLENVMETLRGVAQHYETLQSVAGCDGMFQNVTEVLCNHFGIYRFCPSLIKC